MSAHEYKHDETTSFSVPFHSQKENEFFATLMAPPAPAAPMVLSLKLTDKDMAGHRTQLQASHNVTADKVIDFAIELDNEYTELSFEELKEALRQHRHKKYLAKTPYYDPDHR